MNVPGEQGELVVEPVLQLEPGGQPVHSDAAVRPVLLEKVPAKHGSSADAPCGQKLPAPHVLHAVDPEAAWKLPAVQVVHSDWPVITVNVPGEHGVFDVEPMLQLEPAGHAVHRSALLSFGVLEYVPAKHGSGADAPAGQNEPPGQALHPVKPDAS